MKLTDMLDNILLQVNKPGQYIGQEWNSIRKDFNEAEIRFALCFPDLYEVGMSNLGMRIIYGILNSLPHVCCERFFAVGFDLERILRSMCIEISSLESKRRLREFDMIGFSLNYELDYTNVLNILDLGKIPLMASSRDNRYPLVIGGGPCVFNPEPMHEFFDLFVIGEAEEAIIEILDIYRSLKEKFKVSKINKQELLLAFSNIEGVYVPSLYEVAYSPEAKIEKFRPKIENIPSKIKKRFVEDLNNAFFPLGWLVPFVQIVHDRIILEVMRGCPNRCRFCQARSQYFPFRQRGIKNLLDLSCSIYKRTGYEEISLAGLSVSDYPGIEELTRSLTDLFKDRGISISLPSIKPKAILGELSSLIANTRKTGLTFAPEAATEKLRAILNKDFNTSDFFKVVEQAYLVGYRHVKLYFMIGLPYEEQDDLDGILEFATTVSELRRKINFDLSSSGLLMTRQTPKAAAAEVNLSINTFIPKPHTPFQWLKMQGLDDIKNKQEYLRKRMKKNKWLRMNFHNPRMSFLEGVLSRGDRRLSQVILCVFNKGARFDSWGEHFVFENWLEAFKECNINPNFYLKEKEKDGFLPWDFLETGIDKESLLMEFNRAIQNSNAEKPS